ncbi:hypothetical protein [Streptomyces sp. NBC_00582]|uniref:hypothetical protein n=1 Tax=Streptomyces sp. NBC_00582 TaxID=2975783 RepID=UPI001063C9F9|nr:hypothetical protein [Streptomyces sp. NBC_00582]WUB60171.1 hypothetical protein OG852_07100 [Streptomyces sp. NBC_00582]
MTLEALLPVLLVTVAGASQLAREVVRRNSARRIEEAHGRTLVDLLGRCGPDSEMVDRRSDGTVLTVRSGAAAGRGDRRG